MALCKYACNLSLQVGVSKELESCIEASYAWQLCVPLFPDVLASGATTVATIPALVIAAEVVAGAACFLFGFGGSPSAAMADRFLFLVVILSLRMCCGRRMLCSLL